MNNDTIATIPATLETLTPLHIGDGEEYIQGLDIIEYNNKKIVINPNALFQLFKHDPDKIHDLSEELKNNTLNAFVKSNAKEIKELIERGMDLDIDTGKNIKRYIKDGTGNAYIPGSSIKGSLRTAILKYIMDEEGYTFELKSVNNNMKYADQNITKKYLGKDPLLDIMKLIRITDAYTNSQPVKFFNIDVENTDKRNLKDIPFEMVERGMRFSFSVTIENFFFEQDRNIKNNSHKPFNFKLTSFDNLIDMVDRTSLYLLFRHTLWKGAETLRGEYQKLIDCFDSLDTNETIMNIGAGAGWIGMTGDIIGGEMNDSVRNRLNLDTNHLDFEFPKTRKFVKLPDGKKVPMGWVKVTFEGLTRSHDMKKLKEEMQVKASRVFDDINKTRKGTVKKTVSRPISEGEVVEIKITEVKNPHSIAETVKEKIKGTIFIGDIAHERINNVDDYLKAGEIKKARVKYRQDKGKEHLNFSLKDVTQDVGNANSQEGKSTYSPFKDLDKKK